jgi:hypothetical protein
MNDHRGNAAFDPGFTVRRLEPRPRDRRAHIPPEDASEGVNLTDFYAIMPSHTYIYCPTRAEWPAASINSRIPPIPLLNEDGSPKLSARKAPLAMTPSAWLDKHRPVEQVSWFPGKPMIIENQLVIDGEIVDRPGVSCFNLYRPPSIKLGDALQATPWLDHVRYLYSEDEVQHFIRWCAQRVQQPHIKVNHAIVMGGEQGLGKDTLLEPLKQAVGPWNFAETSPAIITGRFTGFLKSVVLRVSEIRDTDRGGGERVDRYQLYDHMKTIIAAPPDTHRIDEKHIREYYIPSLTGVAILTNHKQSGLYLPRDDRRHFVMWSDKKPSDEVALRCKKLWEWYADGGINHVVAYLASVDLSQFDPKAPPPKTPAWYEIVDANRSPEDAELDDILEALGRPAAVTMASIAAKASIDNPAFKEWLTDRKNSKVVVHRLEAVRYTKIRNDNAEDGLWRIDGKKQAVYGRAELSVRERLSAVQALQRVERYQ